MIRPFPLLLRIGVFVGLHVGLLLGVLALHLAKATRHSSWRLE